jgi:hypothetical protein
MAEGTVAIAQLAEGVDTLNQGLGSMLVVLAGHTRLLKEILQAVTAKPEGPSPLERALSDIFESLNRIENDLAQMRRPHAAL